MNAIVRNILIVGAVIVAVKVTAKALLFLDDDLEPPEALAAAIFLVVCAVVAGCWWLFINLPPPVKTVFAGRGIMPLLVWPATLGYPDMSLSCNAAADAGISGGGTSSSPSTSATFWRNTW